MKELLFKFYDWPYGVLVYYVWSAEPRERILAQLWWDPGEIGEHVLREARAGNIRDALRELAKGLRNTPGRFSYEISEYHEWLFLKEALEKLEKDLTQAP